MSLAWETTDEDVANVLSRLHPSRTYTVKETIQILGNLDHNKIEKAALYGNDIDEQTNYAYDEIEKQLKKMGS